MTVRNKKLSKKIIFIFLISLISGILYAQSNTTTIKIESAESTAYKKNAETGDDEILLKGSVSLSVTKGSSTTVIKADSVTYNRVTDMIYASGNITLKQTGSGAGDQNISADTLLFNTSTLEGVFDNGRVIQTQSDAINLPSGSTLIVASEIFGRDSSGTIDFKNAELTFCDDENPHWKIKASNIWLLPGGEFAFFNALLTIGSVPLLYLPAFYYPKDELVFNPSFGYHERKGYYFQTTTYLYGRKPLNNDSSSGSDDDITKNLFNFMKSSSMKEQVREGLVLHNLDADFKGDTTNYFKIMGDYYTNLGVMVGAQGVYKPKKYISNIQGNLNLGFSNTVFEKSGQYMPYSPEGKLYYDYSNFMGMSLPFRYGADFQISMNKPFSLSLSLPIYSDPYFKDDFGTRSEYIDWIGFLMSSADKEKDSTTSNTVSSFTWTANGSYTVPLPAVVKPYISSLAVSSLSSSLVFSSKTRNFSSEEMQSKESAWKTYSPERYFYYPSQVTPLKISGKLSGTLVNVTGKKSSAKSKNKNVKYTVPLEVPEEFLTEEEIQKLAEKKAAEKSNEQSSDGKENESAESEIAVAEKESINESEKSLAALKEKVSLKEEDLPLLTSNDSVSVTSMTGVDYSLTYSVTPQYTSQISYNASSLTSPEEFKWNEVYSTYYQVKIPATLSSKLGYRSNFASLTNTLNFNPVFQDHPNLDGYTETAAAAVKKTDYSAKKLDLTNTNTVSLKPFIYTSIFKNTSLDWNTNIKVIRTEFTGEADNPQWEYKLADLTDEEAVSAHSLSATISAVEGKFSQVLTLTTKLPPLVDAYNASLKLQFPYVTLNLGAGIEQKSKEDPTFKFKPIQESATVSLFNSKLSLSQSFNYELEDEKHPESLRFSASFKGLSLAYTMSYTKNYSFDENEGWKLEDTESFLPYSASLSYSTSSKTFKFKKDKISLTPSLNTSIVYDFLRPTNSYFRFVPSLTFKINDLLDLSFSSESRNNVVYRYIEDYAGHPDLISGEKNPLVDLWNSFVFWDDEHFWDPNQTKRKASGYKLKSLSLTLTHNLCDWDLSSSLTFKPRSTTDDNGNKIYDYHPYFSVSVSWRPMASLKTEIVDEYGEWKLNP